MSFNKDGVRYIHERTRPLSVYSMDDAQEAIAAKIAKGPSPSTTPEQWARHLAWVIGFDRLIEDRKKIHEVTGLIV